MAKFTFMAIGLFLTHVPTKANRMVVTESTELQRDHNAMAGKKICRNYCVQCNDGSTVFYDRTWNKWKGAASAAVGAVGAGGIGGYVAVGGAVAHASGGVRTAGEETSTKWEGAIPTSGLHCERMNVTYFSHASECGPVLFMEKSTKKFGRVKNNMLKPYDDNGEALPGFDSLDYFAYKKGCKILKASGKKGKWAQIQSVFQGKCTNKVDKGAKTCSEHSKLCGNKGVKGLIAVKTADECRQSCATPPAEVECTES